MDGLVWLEEYMDKVSSANADDLMLEAGEPGFKEHVKAAAIQAKADLKSFIAKIIAKIKEIVETLKLKYAKLKFSSALKKLGKSYKKEIKAVNGSKEITALAIKAMKLEQKYAKTALEAWNKYASGKLSSENYESVLESMEKKYDADMLIFEKQLDVLCGESADKRAQVFKTGLILADYDHAIQSMMSCHSLAFKDTEKVLNDVADTNIEKVAEKVAGGSSEENYNESWEEASVGRIRAAAHMISAKLSSMWNKFTAFISKAIARIAHRGDSAVRKAAGGSSEENHNESWEEAWNDIETMLDAGAVVIDEG